jgi:prophage regulatory protein
MSKNLLRLKYVLNDRGRSRSAHYRDIKQGLFTKPVQIGPRAVAWPAHEVAAINAARIAGKPEDAIKQLVVDLEAARLGGEEVTNV